MRMNRRACSEKSSRYFQLQDMLIIQAFRPLPTKNNPLREFSVPKGGIFTFDFSERKGA